MAYSYFIIYLALSLCTTLSTSADEFLSIDCGSSLPYKDGNGITWVGDDKYVLSGESRSVKPENSTSYRVADTLRVFTIQNKNCYHIDSVKQGRVLVRAGFNYGNYDGKNSPPTFALHFDGNEWVDVDTSDYYFHEVTYVMKRDTISICLTRTEPDQFPFITYLQIRSLEMSMYSNAANIYPLFLWKRVVFGTNTTIRYSDDIYDRLWLPGLFNNGSIQVRSDALFSELKSSKNLPPPAVLKHAITAISPNSSIELLMRFPSYEMNAYINWYFSEVTRLQPNQTRSFRIFKDNKSYSDPILQRYEDCNELYVSGITVSSKTTFSLVPTNVSTLPPLINAMEVFRIGDSPLTDGTNKRDVRGLASLQERFEVLRGWSGDPCLPAPHTWDWIKCNDNPIPRVTALSLGRYGLSGLLPDFSSLDALQTIDLHNNSLRGPIPDFLGTFVNLKTLDLSHNHFSGALPDSLANNNKIKLNLAGNSLQLPPPANTAVQFPLPIPTAKLIVPRLQLLFPPLAPNPPNPQFYFPPLAPNPPNDFPPLAPNLPNRQSDLPPLAPNPQSDFPPLFPNLPNPRSDFPSDGGGGGGGGGGSYDTPQLGKKTSKPPRTINLPRILKFTLIPTGTISAVVGAICCCKRCRRKHNANAGAANSGVAENVVDLAVSGDKGSVELLEEKEMGRAKEEEDDRVDKDPIV